MTNPANIIGNLTKTPAIIKVRRLLTSYQILQTALAIQQIPAPTFAEEERAQWVKSQFEHAGLSDIAMDDLFNVFGRWPGTNPTCPAVMVSAHLDTVFPEDTDLSVHYDHNRIYGPGLGDNSLGVAALISLLTILRKNNMSPAADIWFVANSREEGLGDLGGIRAAWQRLNKYLGAAIVIEGMGLGRIYHAGIAVRRLRITCQAEGGHSWQHFGRPTAIHGLVNLGARITSVTPPSSPRTTYNIGLISGGHSVNSLASHAELYLDLRSESPTTLAELEQQVNAAINAVQQPDLTFSTEIVGDRPAGRIDPDHFLVQLAAEALQTIDHQAFYETGSTDANVLLANNLPAVTIGIAYGGNSHRQDEYIETGQLTDGVWHLLLLTLATAEHLAQT